MLVSTFPGHTSPYNRQVPKLSLERFIKINCILEESPNNRAGCQNAECKKAAIKITKGELRYAIQVTINEHQSWQYRHWGCVTPKQISNLIETTEGDTELVDGFDELSDENQEKIKFALENGHIPDEDWKGVSPLHLQTAAT